MLRRLGYVGLLLALLAVSGRAQGQAAQFKYRWVWVMQNLMVDEQVPKLQALMQRAKKAGYNGIALADFKFNVLDRVTPNYYKNIAAIQETARQLDMALIPTVCPIGYSNGLLAHDPNLAEGLPVRDAVFVVKGSEAQVVTPEAEGLKNGGFEAASGDKMTGWDYQDNPGGDTFSDTTIKHGGMASLRMENIGKSHPTNARVIQKVIVPPYRQMHLSCWIKTDAFDRTGDVHATVLGADGRSLNHVNWHIQKTQDWTRYNTIFNSLNNASVNVYFGVWGGNAGKIWFDDAHLEEAGLVNVLRRDGCPLTVRGEDNTIYKEGVDFEPVKDARMGVIPYEGEYEVWHAPPGIHLKPGSRIRDGQQLRVSFYHNVKIYDDQVCACISEPKVYALLKEQINGVQKLLHPTGYFLSHDEFRVANWCAACQARNLTPGQMLADNTRRCIQMARQANPKADIFIWSDMYDPFHNAVDENYYLVNGPWKGSWEGLPPDAVVVNWNPDHARESLGFFANRGNPQILAGYYDGDPNSIKTWLGVGKGIRDKSGKAIVQGVMYTTWNNNYDALETFARSAWGQ